MESKKLKAEIKKPAHRQQCPPPAAKPAVRVPYADADLPGEESGVRSQKPESVGHGVFTARDTDQRDFEASGAAASQNAKLVEFFNLPHNFGQWFSSTFLEELSGATRMNNRAIDLREHYRPAGLYVDNCMIKHGETGSRHSHYRICKIEDAVSLNDDQKAALLRNHRWQPEKQNL